MDASTLLTATAITGAASAAAWWLTSRFFTGKYQPMVAGLEKQLTSAQQQIQVEVQQANQHLENAAQHYARLEESFAAHQQEATNRAGLQSRRISELEVSLHTTTQSMRELEAQLPNALKRIGDLEASLTAEKGRVGALQSAVDAKHELANQLTVELSTARSTLSEERDASRKLEAALRTLNAEHEQSLATTTMDESGLKAELDKAAAALTAHQADADAKLADAKRKLVAAETKANLLQKEIMNIVGTGGASQAAASVVAAEDQAALKERVRTAEKRAQELEAKLSQTDSETRKKLREAEYRVCELEFKLAEAEEKKSA